MSDVLSKRQRSFCMSRIEGKDTRPEVMLRKALWKQGVRYQLHASVDGRPDLVVMNRKVAVFVDGCFWHRCPIHYVTPNTREEFWADKISKNVARDSEVNQTLTEKGWAVLRFWEHEIKDDLEGCVSRVMEALGR